ncbi:MAG: hypothetical protein E6J91_39725 [Deltaproteobacteria bacterium]|nr:MAG: hypothetical protein E6J91_39725 [Deltaproteobacteria bacterium]
MSEPSAWDPDTGTTAVGGPPINLGALERSGAFSLATLDDELVGASPSDGTLPASIGPMGPRPAQPARPRPQPIDRFAPPEFAVAEPLLELAEDERAHHARRHASAPPPAQPIRSTPSGPPQAPPEPRSMSARPPAPGPVLWQLPDATPRESPRLSQPEVASPPAPGSAPAAGPASSEAPGRGSGAAFRGAVLDRAWLASARVRFAAGIVLAIVLGFVPAHLVAGIRERSAFAVIDRDLIAAQAAADMPDSYAALDALRAEKLDAKRSAHRSIALASLLIWGAAGGALAYVWFRRIPWDRLGDASG